MNFSVRKDLRRILERAEACGWVFKITSNHIKGTHPNGQTATIGKTPSDHRALKNIEHHLKLRKQNADHR